MSVQTDRGGVARSREGEVLCVLSKLGATPAEPFVERLTPRPGKADVYVVRSASTPSALVAKLQDGETCRLEQRVYDLLVGLSVSSIRCHGVVPADDAPLAWLVTEYASGTPFMSSAPEHRSALALWLGPVHVGARRRDEVVDLPDHGSEYWRGVVVEAVRTLNCGIKNDRVTPDQRQPLATLALVFEQILRDWPSVVELMGALPNTLTHGDLVPQNIRIANRAGSLVPLVHDWGQAGWGNPLVDLLWVDSNVYLSSIGADVAMLPMAPRLRALGTAMWTAFVLRGERPNLASSWPHHSAEKIPAYVALFERRGVGALLSKGASQ